MQMATGLLHLHSRGIIHRDLKSLNIFISKSGELKIGDFSESKQLGIGKMLKPGNTRVGSPFTLAPELVRRQKSDFRSDIWALGVTWFSLIFSKPPYQEESIPKLLKAIVQKPLVIPKNNYSQLLN
jgi:serine/threonine protein kinase